MSTWKPGENALIRALYKNNLRKKNDFSRSTRWEEALGNEWELEKTQ